MTSTRSPETIRKANDTRRRNRQDRAWLSRHWDEGRHGDASMMDADYDEAGEYDDVFNQARAMAIVTGSMGATYIREVLHDDGTRTEISATYRRPTEPIQVYRSSDLHCHCGAFVSDPHDPNCPDAN